MIVEQPCYLLAADSTPSQATLTDAIETLRLRQPPHISIVDRSFLLSNLLHELLVGICED